MDLFIYCIFITANNFSHASIKILKKYFKNIDVVQLGTLTYLGPDLSKIRTQISGLSVSTAGFKTLEILSPERWME